MNVKHGAQEFFTPLGLTKVNRRHFPLQPICAERKGVLTIVGHSTFPVLMVTRRRAATRKIIKINPPDEIICTVLRLHDEKRPFCRESGSAALYTGILELWWCQGVVITISYMLLPV